jgi:SsrA-binding protein
MKRKPSTGTVVNRRAGFDYELGEEIIAGLALSGAEVKAARLGHVQLKGSYVTVRAGELWLINASFSLPSVQRGSERTVDSRSRKLLAHRRQIDKLIAAKNQGLTIVPTKLLTRGRFVKLVIATGRGKKKYDKRQAIKQRDTDREIARGLAR